MKPSPNAVDQSEKILSDDGFFKCFRCGHRWKPRKPTRHPRSCSFCRSAYWDSPTQDTLTPQEREESRKRIVARVYARRARERKDARIRELKIVAKKLGPESVGIVSDMFIQPSPEVPHHAAFYEHKSTSGRTIPAVSGMPPPPKFEDSE